MPRVFISRPLSAESPFAQLATQAEWEVVAQSLVVFEKVVPAYIPVADWLFFYSSRGVQYYFEQAPNPPPSVKLAAIGSATAQTLTALGFSPQFIGQGSPDQVAKFFLPLVKGQRVVFIGALHSRQSVQQYLGNRISSDHLVVYENRPRLSFPRTEADYYIFTSPLNFQAFQQLYPFNAQDRLIAIGTTTAVSFEVAGVKGYRMAKAPAESELLSCLLAWEAEANNIL